VDAFGLVDLKLVGHLSVEVLVYLGDEDVCDFVQLAVEPLRVAPHVVLQKLLDAVTTGGLLALLLALRGVVSALHEKLLPHQTTHLLLPQQRSLIAQQVQQVGSAVP
jgi:hypothetical protein